MNSKNALIFAVGVIMLVGIMFDGGSPSNRIAANDTGAITTSGPRPATFAQADIGSAPKRERRPASSLTVGRSTPVGTSQAAVFGDYDPDAAAAGLSRVAYPGRVNTRFDPRIEPGQTQYR